MNDFAQLFYQWVNHERVNQGITWQDLANKIHQAGYRTKGSQEPMDRRAIVSRLQKKTHSAEFNAYLRHVLTKEPIIPGNPK